MIVELMRAGGPDLVRRWIATLLSVPADEREAVVESIEARIAELYHTEPVSRRSDGDESGEVRVRLKAKRKAPLAD
jgi:hypothetical protein